MVPCNRLVSLSIFTKKITHQFSNWLFNLSFLFWTQSPTDIISSWQRQAVIIWWSRFCFDTFTNVSQIFMQNHILLIQEFRHFNISGHSSHLFWVILCWWLILKQTPLLSSLPRPSLFFTKSCFALQFWDDSLHIHMHLTCYKSTGVTGIKPELSYKRQSTQWIE